MLTPYISPQLIVIASIHQPSTSTFNLFDKLLLLSSGQPHYFGPVSSVTSHYESLGIQMPLHVNPAEFLLEMVNTDFTGNSNAAAASAQHRTDQLHKAWLASPRARELDANVTDAEAAAGVGGVGIESAEKKPSSPSLVLTLLHRSFVKSYRDVVVYGIRLAMYTGELPATQLGDEFCRLTNRVCAEQVWQS